MSENIRLYLRRSVSFLLAVVLLMSGTVLLGGSGTVNAAKSGDASKFKDNANVKKYQQAISDLEKKQANLKNEIASLKDNVSDLKAKKATYDELVEVCESRIAASEELIEELKIQAEELDADIAQKKADGVRLYEQIKERIVVSYEFGGTKATYLELIFGAESLFDFMVGIDNAICILEYDMKLMEEYRDLTYDLEEEYDLREASISEQKELVKSLEAQREEAETLSLQSERLIENAMKDIESSAAIMSMLEAEEKAAAKKLDDFIEELIKKSGTTQSVTEGAYMWPLDTRYTTITSRFGLRKDPFGSGAISNHGGTDIYAPEGANIYASNTGTVVKAGKDPSYGNYIMIDHGGNIFTLYAHCSKLLVSEGARVTKGTAIAKVGHTGSVTGNHLHFEVREGKTRVDALKYVKKP